MFRKPPPSKLEVLQESLVDTLDNLRDAVADLPVDKVSKKAAYAKDHAGETVSQGWDVALRRAGAAVSAAGEHLQHVTATLGQAAGTVGSTVGSAAHAAGERFADLSSRAGDYAHHAGEQARDAASHAGDYAADARDVARSRSKQARGQAQDAAGQAREAASNVAAQAAGVASHVSDVAHDRAGWLFDRARHLADDLAHRAHDAQDRAAHVTADAVENAGSRVAQVHDTLDDAHESFFNRLAGARHSAQQAAQHAADAAAAASAVASKRAAKHAQGAKKKLDHIHPTQVVVEDSSSKWMWIGVGLLAGAAIALLVTPSSGRRNRALIGDQLNKARKGAESLGSSATAKAHDLQNKANGALAERRTAGTPDSADDGTIADRVRTALGESPVTKNLERLNVDVYQGLVTLRGPVADEALQAGIEKVVRAVRGVKDVKLDLLLEETEDSPTFIG